MLNIPDLLETGYFNGAVFSCSIVGRYRIQSQAYSQKSLEEYLSNDAEWLRADFCEHFPKGIELSRDNWKVLQSWKVEKNKLK